MECNDSLSRYRPVVLYILMFVLVGLSIIISPSFLIDLGPMRTSLTSQNELTRNTAEISVVTFRVICGVLSFICAVILLKWKNIIYSNAIQSIIKHKSLSMTNNLLNSNYLFNKSFWLIISINAIAFIYFAVGDKILSGFTLIFIGQEDGLIEYASAFTFLGCSVISIVLAFKLKDIPNRFTVHIAFAILFFMCFGEELSWGQRILGFEVSDNIKQINVQGEFNIHNMFGYLADELFILGVLTYGFIMPTLTRYHFFWRHLFDKLGLPIATTGLSIGFLIVSLIWHNWAIGHFIPSHTGIRAAEIREFLSAICFLVLMRENFNLIPKNSD